MRLWIDDLRKPNQSWKWAKSSKEAIALLARRDPKIISFDHDLGGDDDAMKVIRWIEIWAANKQMQKFEWQVHSMNPVGRENIKRAMQRIEEKYWS
jgi:hypothetical protein